MRTPCFFAIIIATIFGACGQGSTSNSANATSPANTGDTTGKNSTTASMNMDTSKSPDAAFLRKAYSIGLFEIQAGKLADKNSNDAHVKKFATMVIEDHTKMNENISALSQKEGVNLPSELMGDDKTEYNKLQGLTGSAFDKEYIGANVTGHKQAIQLFENISNGSGPQDSKTLAKDDVPVLKKHLNDAEKVQKELSTGTAGLDK